MGRGRPSTIGVKKEKIIKEIEEKQEILESSMGRKDVLVAWDFCGSANKKVRTHALLFGRKNNGCYVDGILDRWENEKRVARIKYYKVKAGVYIFPSFVWDKYIREILDKIGVTYEAREATPVLT